MCPQESSRRAHAELEGLESVTRSLNQLLLQDSGLTKADYEILAMLSEHPTDRMPAREVCALLRWEKSRLSRQVRHLQAQGLVHREPNPADGCSSKIVLLPGGRRAIEEAAPEHVRNVRRLFIDLLTSAELETVAALHERVLRRLDDEPLPEQSAHGKPALRH